METYHRPGLEIKIEPTPTTVEAAEKFIALIRAQLPSAHGDLEKSP